MSKKTAGLSAPSGETSNTDDLDRWSQIVAQIKIGDAASLEELYNVMHAGIRFYLWRQLGVQDLDDRVHDVFLIVTTAIQTGEVREPSRLMGFVMTVVRRYIAGQIGKIVRARRRLVEVTDAISDTQPDPERSLAVHEQVEIAARVLGGLRQREREILVRFYLQGQSPTQICRDMDLTDNQFRIEKSRAK